MLSGIRGTVWSGSAASATIGGLPVQDVRWQVRPWTLLTGRVGGKVEARLPDGFLSTGITASTSRVQFNDLRGGASLATIASLLPLRGIRGQASVALSSFEIENGWPTRVLGELKLAALEVASFVPSGGSSSMVPLGDYTVTFGDAPARTIAARFVDNGGPLEGRGHARAELGARVYVRRLDQTAQHGFARSRRWAECHDGRSRRRRTAPPDPHGFVVAGQPRNFASSGKYKPR